MFSFFKSIIALLNSNKKYTDEICNLNRSKKLFFTGHEELSISASNDKIVADVTKIAYSILKRYKDTPKEVLSYMENKGTCIVFAPTLLPLLKILGYNAGFIPQHSSIKALIVNIAISIIKNKKLNFSCELPDTIFVCQKEISLYFVAYNFHHWLAYKSKLPGYDFESLSLFKSTYNNCKNVNTLDINQILSMKDAIDRDKQACEFVMKFVQEQISTKERLEKIIEGKQVKI